MVSAARQTELTVDLGDGSAKLISLNSLESLSQHFTITLELMLDEETDLLPYLGRSAAVSVSEDGELLRHFNGIAVSAERREEVSGAGFVYSMTLRPLSFLHSQGRDFKIFQNKTTKEIIQSIFDDCGIEAEFKLSGSTPNRSYCVQYGESNFGFASRLMEQDGLYYFYRHTDANHILVVCDSPTSHLESDISPLKFNAASGGGANVDSAARFDDGHSMFVQEWKERVSTGAESKVTLWDFDFMKPEDSRKAETKEEGVHDLDTVEVYDFPGRFYEDKLGTERTKSLLESRRANRRVFSGEANNSGIALGTTFALRDHPVGRYNRSYLVTQCSHSLANEQYRAEGQASEASGNTVDFEAVPADTKWRSALTARRPVVLGPETAIVTGPQNETIYTDKFGRIKVQFHWDRQGKRDENSSCWIRVAQTGGLGNNILPRVGHEVIVDFMGGDPDRPVILGRVFNQAHMPVYTLPDHKTKALWRTLTYGDAVDPGAKKDLDTKNPLANELRFEDKAGAEEVFFHAQKDMNIRTIYNQTNKLGNDQSVDIGQHRKMEIGVDDTVKIGNNRETKIGTDEKREIGSNRNTKIGTDETLKVGSKIKINAGSEILIEAGAKMTLVVGGSKITMQAATIDIATTKLTMNGSAIAEMSSGGGATVKGSLTTIQGAMVKIN